MREAAELGAEKDTEARTEETARHRRQDGLGNLSKHLPKGISDLTTETDCRHHNLQSGSDS